MFDFKLVYVGVPKAIVVDKNNVHECIDYVNSTEYECMLVYNNNLSFLKHCPSIRFLKLFPISEGNNCLDFSPVYSLKELTVLSLALGGVNTNPGKININIDISKLENLTWYIGDIKNACNFNRNKLIGLTLYDFSENDNELLCPNDNLKMLELIFSKNISLKVTETLKQIHCLFLSYNRYLKNIDHISNNDNSLTALSIENCPNIEDLSVIGELENLEFLRLLGGRKIKSFSFLKKCKNLKTFVTDYKSEDGDMSFIKNLSYAYLPCCRHYNIKPKDLPNGKFYMGTDGLPWYMRFSG